MRLFNGGVICLFFLSALGIDAVQAQESKVIRVGMIGLDTSHSIAFAKEMNNTQDDSPLGRCQVVAAYPYGSRDIESSYSRIPQYTTEIQKLGVEVVDSLEVLLKQVDAVLLETNDGKPHLEQALQVFRAGKPVFIDKPTAAHLADVVAIYRAAEKYKVPMFSSSSLRYSKNAQAIRAGSLGDVVGCDTYSPCSLEASHTDLYWYGIHGCELLYTVMGVGCQEVVRISTDDTDMVVGQWKGGRIGTFRGLRSGKRGYGGTAFGTTGSGEVGPYDGYRPLVEQIARFFMSGDTPIPPEETLELYTFMEAADLSKQRGGVRVSLEEVRRAAEAEATTRLSVVDP